MFLLAFGEIHGVSFIQLIAFSAGQLLVAVDLTLGFESLFKTPEVLILGTSRYLENSTELGKQVETQFTEKGKALSSDERLSAYNAHM